MKGGVMHDEYYYITILLNYNTISYIVSGRKTK